MCGAYQLNIVKCLLEVYDAYKRETQSRANRIALFFKSPRNLADVLFFINIFPVVVRSRSQNRYARRSRSPRSLLAIVRRLTAAVYNYCDSNNNYCFGDGRAHDEKTLRKSLKQTTSPSEFMIRMGLTPINVLCRPLRDDDVVI